MTLTMIASLALACRGPCLSGATSITIDNEHPRRDTKGDIIDAHDGCVEVFKGRYYLYLPFLGLWR